MKMLCLAFLMFISAYGFTQEEGSHGYVISDVYDIGPFKQLSKHRFQYGYNKGALHDFEYLFQQEPELKELFDGFNRARKNGVIGNTVTGIIIGGTGIYVGTVFQSRDGEGFVSAFVGGVIASLPYGAISALTVIATSKVKKNRYRSELLSSIYPSFVDRSKYAPRLYLGLTQHGVGLAVSF